MTDFYKSLVVVLSSFLLFFFMSGHMSESVAAFIGIFKIEKMQLRPVIPEQVFTLLAIGIIGFIGINRR